MEQRGALLRGIAKVLNAGGSGLLAAYDAVASTVSQVLPGEKEKLRSQIREYEKKMDKVYYEIGRDVSKHADMAQAFAAAEEGTKSVLEHQAAIEKMKKRISEIGEEERIARENALKAKEAARMARDREIGERVIASIMRKTGEEKAESVPGSEKIGEVVPVEEAAPVAEEAVTPVVAETPADTEMPDAEKGDGKEVEGESTAAPGDFTDVTDLGSSEPLQAEAPTIPEKEEKVIPAKESALPEDETPELTPEALERMRKTDLLALCKTRGIEADKTMTKAEIIQLLL